MTPKQLIDIIIKEEPFDVGRSRIQVVGHLLSSTAITRWKNGIPDYKNKNNGYPVPKDLWDVVLKTGGDCTKITYPQPVTTEDFQNEQTYLGTHACHWRQIFGWDITPESAIWKTTPQQLLLWKDELIPALWFWATHVNATETKAGGVAALFLASLAPELMDTALAKFVKNQNNLKKIKDGKQLQPKEILDALGWDTSAHQGHFSQAAKIALENHYFLLADKKTRKQQERFTNNIYCLLLDSEVDLKQLKVPKDALKKLVSSRKFHRDLDKRFPGGVKVSYTW